VNQPAWYSIPAGQAGPTVIQLCRQWLDRALPRDRDNSVENRELVGKELPTCTSALIDQKKAPWVPGRVAAALGHDHAVVADALAAAAAGRRKNWLTEDMALAAAAVVIGGHASRLAYTVCGIGRQALDRLREEVNAQDCAFPRRTREQLKERAPRQARDQLTRGGRLADEHWLAKLLPPAGGWEQVTQAGRVADERQLAALLPRSRDRGDLVELIARELLNSELKTPTAPQPVEGPGDAAGCRPQPDNRPPAVEARAVRTEGEAQRADLLNTSGGRQLREQVARYALGHPAWRPWIPEQEKVDDVFLKAVDAVTIKLLLEKVPPAGRTLNLILPLLSKAAWKLIYGQESSEARRKLRERTFGEALARDRPQPRPEDWAHVSAAIMAAAAIVEQDDQQDPWVADCAGKLLRGLAGLHHDALDDAEILPAWKAWLGDQWDTRRPAGPLGRRRAAAVDLTIDLIRAALGTALGRGGSA
jgi:hypothetical protein